MQQGESTQAKAPRGHGRRIPLKAVAALAGVAMLAVVLALRGQWLALLLLPLVALLAAAWPAPPVTSEAPMAPAGLRPLLHDLLPVWARQVALAESQLTEGSERLLTHFSGLLTAQAQGVAALAQQPPDTAEALAAAQRGESLCEVAMQDLQMCDRVGQMLDVVKRDQRRLADQLDEMDGAGPAAAQRWLSELAGTYTTEEQQAAHRGEVAPAPRQGVQFF